MRIKEKYPSLSAREMARWAAYYAETAQVWGSSEYLTTEHQEALEEWLVGKLAYLFLVHHLNQDASFETKLGLPEEIYSLN